MSSFGQLKKYLMLFAIVQVLGLANVQADQPISHRGGGGGQHQHSQHSQHQHSQYQHHQDTHHPSYGEGQGRGKTGVFIAPQENGDQNSNQQSQPDNPLYDAESQQLQQQGQ